MTLIPPPPPICCVKCHELAHANPPMKRLQSIIALLCLLTIDASAEEQVFFSFDDVSIPWRDNLKLTLEQPKKHSANPVLRAGAQDSADGWGALLYGTVIKEGGKFRMWYIAWPQTDASKPQPYYRPVAYAESSDGVTWVKPDLGLVEFRGTKHNNLVRIEPTDAPFARTNDYVSVLRDDAEPDATRRYKMAYILYSNADGFSTTATAVSPDGLSWQLVNKRPFTKGHFENTSLIRFQGNYHLTGQNVGRAGGSLADGREAGRTMTGFFSPDFRHWSGGRAMNFFRSHATPTTENTGQELHMGAGLWNRGNVVVGLYGRWYGDTISIQPDQRKITPVFGLKVDLGLVVSNDAIHYREPVQNFIFVPRGSPSEWDSEAILQAQAFCNTETETFIWYGHWDSSNRYPVPPLPAKNAGKPMGVGLLTMRRDGFGYLSKQRTEAYLQRGQQHRDADASVLTQRVTLSEGGKAFLNVTGVTSDAPMRVSIVDEAEQPLPGTGVAIVTKNGVRVPLTFGDGGLPANKPFRLRVEWPSAADPHFYALYLDDE